ncbi:MAG: sn-glycerol-1-phosphate dehydrogenase [Nitrososphaerota archaeon]|nr:sn-glycerol-1-phosphate dehydrogenase [Aigarchaeota archaeon]MDW8076686.1 sn-glycerol-1-phosphate dehydrogenase [Nitrososphaerota archaeon]
MVHIMQLPNTIIIGRNLKNKVAEVALTASGGQPVLIITGKTAYSIYGQSVSEIIAERTDIEVHQVEAEISQELDIIRGLLSKKRFAAIVGIGGGKVIDISKASAHEAGVRFVSVPTVASHDGISSPMVSAMDSSQPYSRMVSMPFAIVADIDVIEKAPHRYLASGCGDLVAKYTAVKDWRLSHRVTGEYFGDYAASLAYMSAEIIFRNARKIGKRKQDSIRTVVEALISAGVAMGIAGSSRPCSGSEHLISHALGRLMEDPPLHGERCGVATIFAALAHKAAWKRVKSALSSIGAPSNLSELGVDEQIFVKAVVTAPNIRPDRYTILHKLRPTESDVRRMLREAELG